MFSLHAATSRPCVSLATLLINKLSLSTTVLTNPPVFLRGEQAGLLLIFVFSNGFPYLSSDIADIYPKAAKIEVASETGKMVSERAYYYMKTKLPEIRRLLEEERFLQCVNYGEQLLLCDHEQVRSLPRIC